jgi:hypothetical protein
MPAAMRSRRFVFNVRFNLDGVKIRPESHELVENTPFVSCPAVK